MSQKRTPHPTQYEFMISFTSFPVEYFTVPLRIHSEAHSLPLTSLDLLWSYGGWAHLTTGPEVSAVTQRVTFLYLGLSFLLVHLVFHLRPLAPSEIYIREQSCKTPERFLRINSVRTSYTEGHSPPRDDPALHFWTLMALPSMRPAPPAWEEVSCYSVVSGNGQKDSTAVLVWCFL